MGKRRKNNAVSLLLPESFQFIFQESPVSTQIFSHTGDTIMVNKAWVSMWQIQPKDILHKYNILSDQQLVTRRLMPKIKKAFAGAKVVLPTIQYFPDQTLPNVSKVAYRWVRALMYPIKNKHGAIASVVLQHEDVTASYEARQKLLENEERFRQILEHSADAITLVDKNGMRLYSTRSRRNILGISTNRDIGQSIFARLHPDDISKAKAAFIKLVERPNATLTLELRIRHKNRKWIWIEVTGTNLLHIPHVEAIVLNYRDITLRKNIEDEHFQLAAIVSSSTDIIISKTLEGTITSWNHAATELFGYTFKEAVGHNITIVVPRHLHQQEKEILQKISKGEHIKNFQTERIKKDGTIVIVSVTMSPIKNDEGRIIGASSITRDITEQKQLEQEKSDFLSMVSHELKTPLTSMKMFIELLGRQLEPTRLEEAKYMVSRIHDQTNQLVELTNDLLDVSRIETGKLRLHEDKFPLDALVKETVEALVTSTRTHKLIVQSKAKVSVVADRYRIFQVLVNFLTNAIKYSPNGADIIVNLEKRQKEVIVSVEDFGIGIKKEQQKKIFDRLYQVNDPQEKTYPGLGLGLYISKEIIERHNGKIWLESTKGKGSKFYFSLPLKKKKTLLKRD